MMKDDEHNTRRYAPVWIAMGVVALGVITLVALMHPRPEPRWDEPKQEQKSGAAALFDIDAVKESDTVKNFVKANWPSVLRTCPGITDYVEDLSFVSVSSSTWDASFGPEVSGIGVSLRVSDSPSKVPREFMANGHTCEFRISPDGRTLIIQKTVCADVCFEKAFDDVGHNMLFPLAQ